MNPSRPDKPNVAKLIRAALDRQGAFPCNDHCERTCEAFHVRGETILVGGWREIPSVFAPIGNGTGVKPETLRKSPSTRRETAQKANDILTALSGYLGSAPPAGPMPLPSMGEASPSPLGGERAGVRGGTAPLPLLSPVKSAPQVPAWRRGLKRAVADYSMK